MRKSGRENAKYLEENWKIEKDISYSTDHVVRNRVVLLSIAFRTEKKDNSRYFKGHYVTIQFGHYHLKV